MKNIEHARNDQVSIGTTARDRCPPSTITSNLNSLLAWFVSIQQGFRGFYSETSSREGVVDSTEEERVEQLEAIFTIRSRSANVLPSDWWADKQTDSQTDRYAETDIVILVQTRAWIDRQIERSVD